MSAKDHKVLLEGRSKRRPSELKGRLAFQRRLIDHKARAHGR